MLKKDTEGKGGRRGEGEQRWYVSFAPFPPFGAVYLFHPLNKQLQSLTGNCFSSSFLHNGLPGPQTFQLKKGFVIVCTPQNSCLSAVFTAAVEFQHFMDQL